MTDLEINKALALVIGWNAVDEYPYSDAVVVGAGCNWRRFDYKDWNVIGPIAAKYNYFPRKTMRGDWVSVSWGVVYRADTPQKAIALSVIGGGV